MRKYVEVAVSSTSYSFDMPFTYYVPLEMADDAERGRRVVVPFGKGNKKYQGIILNVLDEYSESSAVKPVIEITDKEPVLSGELMDMIYWMKEHTFCTYFDAVRTFLPAGMNIKINEKYKLADDFPELPLTKEEENILSYLQNASSRREFDSIVEDGNDAEKKKAVRALIEKGFIITVDEARQRVNDSYIKMVRLSDDYILKKKAFKLSPKQKKAALLLEENGSVSVKELCYICSITPGVVKNLVNSGAAEEYQYEAFRISEKLDTENLSDIRMTKGQQAVYDDVAEQMDKKQPCCFLLHGVTGSGKTLIFEKLIEKAVNDKKQALMLIPEIALTPQTVESFRRYFGERIAVLHSGLSLSQRVSEYKRVKENMADVVIGTRSAVFAPLENIGIIIMDEEGDRSYKSSDAAPRYNTADVAKLRCKTHNAVLLMASATPSVESYYYAQKGYYRLLTLDERYNNNPLPEVMIADMESERLNGNVSELSDVLVDEIYKNLNNREQTILLLNRRGYNTVVRCFDCKKTIDCPNCCIPLTYHKANHAMMCHYCGHNIKEADRCPSCGSTRLVNIGYGTQKLEEELSRLFPDASILRMDADTNVSRYAYENNFSDFRDGKYDIMLGTQLIGKGLDFPNVTLVGVIGADRSLGMQDFRGGEQAFSLITQVVGRGGRGDKKGRAVLQTSMPDHYVIEFAARQDYKGFYDDEIKIRKALIFPPVCDICILGFAAAADERADAASRAMLEIMAEKIRREELKFPLRSLGPVRSNHGRINGKYRYRIILKCRNSPEFRKFISESLITAGKDRRFSNVNVFADINGDTGI